MKHITGKLFFGLLVGIFALTGMGFTESYAAELPTDSGMIILGTLPTSVDSGAAVSFTATISLTTSYDVSSVAIVTNPVTNWTSVASGDTIIVNGTMPASSVAFYFTALQYATMASYKSANNIIAVPSANNLIVQDDTRVPEAPQAGALSATRAEALSKTAVRVYDLIDYTGLGSGEANRDKRLVLQIDTTNIASLISDNWIKLLESTTAVNFSNLHYLISSDVDFVKVSLTTAAGQSLAGTYDVEVVLDESSRAILAHISRPGNNLIVQDDTRVPVALQAGALSATRAEALSKTAVRVYDLIDYTGLGSGEANKDKRLVLQIDTTSIASLIYDNWIKLLESTTAVNFSNLHYLTSSDVDLAKVSLTTTAGQSLAGTYDVEVVLDESSRAILAHISRQPSGPVSGDIPPEIPDTTETVTTPVAGSTGGEWRLTLTPPSGATIPNHTPFYVWFMVVNSSVNRAANSILRPYSDDDFFGPFVTESVVDAAGNTVLEVDVDNLKNPDGTQGILPAGSYKIRYADSATRETFVGTTSGTLTTQGTTQNSPDSGSGGCNAGFGSTLMLAAIIPAINAIKRKKK